ncbi:regulatory protein YycH of two-component signal transduction system YycFG [Bacillus pakistanensis]|uniref:Regulatory protein YycH of two-component signal transduction system YycFG n=1 Tax=Rossellomorea pakistanensis TaxID=992288 RepID=A0ABS2NB70_9BACI|nr:two-component system activity regulator YycH [Bacillus pakistanensis]MBM7585106.1 regulatory protein YycH of two-component signal transduction system YycFG [Bacillus pakistanensis]
MNYEKIKSIILTLLVAISVLLTWNVWTYQPNYDVIGEDYTPGVTIGAEKTYKDVFKPFKVLFHQNQATFGTVDDNEIAKMMENISNWNFYELSEVGRDLTQSEFEWLVHGDKRVEILFPDIISFDVLRNLLNFEEKKLPNQSIDRIIVNTSKVNNDTAEVYFVSYSDQLVYKGQIKSAFLTTFNEDFVANSDKHPRYFAEEVAKSHKIFLPEKPIDFPSYRYVLEEINTQTFRDALFSDPNGVTKEFTNDGEQFTDGKSLMELDVNNQILTYVNPIYEETGSSTTTSVLIQESFNFVNEHGGWVDQFQYFKISNVERKIVYRQFINGLPVFNESGMAELSYVLGNKEIYRYQRPYTKMGLQLDSESENGVTLMSGYEVLNYLNSQEDIKPSLIEDIAIGYKLSRDIDLNQNIIIYKPTWYYLYAGGWLPIIPEEMGGTNNGLE